MFGALRPTVSFRFHRGYGVVSREGVVKVGDGCDVPRVAGHGAHKESAGVADEEVQFCELLRKLGDWGCVCGGCLRGTSKEHLLDFGLAPPPDLGGE